MYICPASAIDLILRIESESARVWRVISGGEDIAAPSRKTESKLLRLIYASSPAWELTPEDMAAIEARSAAHNLAEGLTGLLLFRGNSFHAVLEGVPSRVLRRMEVIITDPRHRDLRIVSELDIRTRRFENWSFGLVPRATTDEDDFPPRDDFVEMLARRLR